MLKIGDSIPSVELKKMTPHGIDGIDIAAFLKGKKSILMGVPGAFTPICHSQHVPSFVKLSDSFYEKGIDDIICVSATDPFVMDTWSKTIDPEGKITMLADGNGELVRATGMGFDGSHLGLGLRFNRFVAIVEDGVITSIDIEEKPNICSVSNAASVLKRL